MDFLWSLIYSYFSRHVYSRIYLEVVGKLEKLPGCLIQVAGILYSKKINKSILRPTPYRNMEEIYRYPYELSNTINFFAQHFCVFFNKIFTHFLHVVPRFFLSLMALLSIVGIWGLSVQNQKNSWLYVE